MGYETTLLIGRECTTSDEIKRGPLVTEEGEAYRPYLKDEDGAFIKTGAKETYFMIYAEIDLCKCGYTSEISKIDKENTDKGHHWIWASGGDERSEDLYGEKPKPVSFKAVIDALEKDYQDGEYRRFKWALALLNSMQDESEELSILMFGH